MKRQSNKKIISDPSRYKELVPKYVKMLRSLSSKYSVTDDDTFSNLVNFKQNKDVPRHSWFSYKQGFSKELVEYIVLRENVSKKRLVLDPFSGVGTTNLVAGSLGYKSVGIDINPVATLASNVKCKHYKKADIKNINSLIRKASFTRSSRHIPKSPLLEKSFPKSNFNKLMRIKGFFELISDNVAKSFFKLAYLSIIEDCSWRVKDGNGLKMVPDKKIVKDVYGYYLDRCTKMLDEIGMLKIKEEPIIINGSMMLNGHSSSVKKNEVGIVIFSPPYANCFDYCEVYKLELWMGGFVKEYGDFKTFREMAMRSHVNSSFDHGIKNKNKKVSLVTDTISCFNIWNKNIPDMIRGYFDDMTELFLRLKDVMASGTSCYIVVANSGYKGVLVPTDLLLADIARGLGFKIRKIIKARKIRASSQQMDELHNDYDNLMRESIVILEKE